MFLIALFQKFTKTFFFKSLEKQPKHEIILKLNCSSWDQLFIKLYWLQAIYKAGPYLKLIKDHFSHTGCPKNQNGLILMQKLRYKDIVKILGPLRSFSFLVWCIYGALFRKWIDQANKRSFQPYKLSKKSKWSYFGEKIEI